MQTGSSNMVTMNNAAGGPVGGQQMMGQQQLAQGQQQIQDPLLQLNTYIYDHLLTLRQHDLARKFISVCQITQKDGKPSALQNGVGDAMDTDSKDSKRPDDLPEPGIPNHPSDESFLLEWWCMFWDVFGAAHKRATSGSPAQEYYLQTVNQQRLRHSMQQGLVQNRYPNQLMGMNGMNGMNSNMAKQAMQRNASTPNMGLQQKLMAGQMQRDPSGMDLAGQRPQTPGESAGSPSKRARTDGNGFDGQTLGPGGRPMPNQQMTNNGQLILQNGMNEMTQQQMNAFHAQNGQQKMEGMNGMQQGPMGQQMDGMEPYMPNRLMQNGGGGDGSRHALQDYQMQLMLLEQQNKKRLLQARREQDIQGPGSGAPNPGPPGSGPPGGQVYAPSMSPSGSRGGGPSPNPVDQMKRVGGTPKMSQQGMPGSPMPDMQNRGSPGPNFDPSNGQIAPNMPQQFYSNMTGNGMARAPSSHPQFQMQMANMSPQQLEQLRLASGGRLPNGAAWPQGQQPMMQQSNANQQSPQGMPATQQRHNNMPPPPAPAPEPQQRTQSSSPAQPPAPPTPSHQPKAAPKGKKETAAQKKKNAPKKAAAAAAAAAAATPAAETEPPTPTPSTPITPMAPQFKQNGAANQAAGVNAQQAHPPNASAQAAQPGMDGNGATFGAIVPISDTSDGFNLDFAGIDSSDVLESFDFDSFLHTDDNGGFGTGFDPMGFGGDDATTAS